MKKFLFVITLALFAMTSLTLFTSCSDEEAGQNNVCYFNLGLTNMSYAGTGDVLTYSAEVLNAYYKALGMTNGSARLQGSFDSNKAAMKAKFDAVSVDVAAPGGTYSFTIELTGADAVSSNLQKVASKTFTNK